MGVSVGSGVGVSVSSGVGVSVGSGVGVSVGSGVGVSVGSGVGVSVGSGVGVDVWVGCGLSQTSSLGLRVPPAMRVLVGLRLLGRRRNQQHQDQTNEGNARPNDERVSAPFSIQRSLFGTGRHRHHSRAHVTTQIPHLKRRH